ncbi:Alpha/Beta hydrolase protein [Gigaspora rosea]|uniref:Alpha/Beta hydrolase protein n=1 Tax=Gigaspora rosea TaxID=44941 RepID=A0A397UX12_9GLOM|nr:Alpha/Beta hydrolase protein [Gigaspora rosea]
MSLSKDPPVKSWSSEFYLAVAAIQAYNPAVPIEQDQKQFNEINTFEVPSNIIIEEVILDERYRQESKKHLEKILNQYEDVLDEKWKEPNDKLHGEWVYTKEEDNETDKVILYIHGGGYYLGSPKRFRETTSKHAEHAKARVFATSYRLAPQNQFPASLCDSVAAYLYLLNPVLVDLTHSMPSFWDAKLDKIDILPKKFGFREIGPSSPVADECIANAKALSDKIAQKKPTIVGHPSFTEAPRVQLYCANEALAIPYVSPMLAESLGDLPPILCQVGGLERLRDEGILFSYKAAYPHEYQLPSYATKNFEKSPFKNPTKVILEVYDDMTHGWRMLTFFKTSRVAFERCGDFIKRVTSIKDNKTSMIDLLKEDAVSPSISISPSFIGMRVSVDGEIRELNKTDQDCLKWDKVGIVPKI